MKFLLDANFLLIPGQFKVDIFRELEKFGKPELYTLDSVILELENLAATKKKDCMAARLALELAKGKNMIALKAENENTDKEIERAAVENNFVVCTQDRELIKKLKKGKIKVIALRQKKYLILT